MKKVRLESFSDGVFAIIMTIMVLNLPAPHGVTFRSLVALLPDLSSYVISFSYVAIYWINHHQLLTATRKINRGVLWANLHLLFWISLIPFTTSWVNENHLTPIPVAAYGFVLLMCAVTFLVLERILFQEKDANSMIIHILNHSRREWIDIVIYAAALLLAFENPLISIGLYVVVAGIWMAPNHRLEKVLGEKDICAAD